MFLVVVCPKNSEPGKNLLLGTLKIKKPQKQHKFGHVQCLNQVQMQKFFYNLKEIVLNLYPAENARRISQRLVCYST